MSTKNINKIELTLDNDQGYPSYYVRMNNDTPFTIAGDDSINDLIMNHLNDDILINFMGYKLRPVYETHGCDNCILKNYTDLCVNFSCSNLVFIEYTSTRKIHLENISLDLAKRKLCTPDICMYHPNCDNENHLCLIDYLFKV